MGRFTELNTAVGFERSRISRSNAGLMHEEGPGRLTQTPPGYRRRADITKISPLADVCVFAVDSSGRHRRRR